MVKTINEKHIFEGKILNVFLDEIEYDGVHCMREMVRHPGGVGILAERDGKFAMVKQYRHPIGKYMTEIPAGKREPNEPPLVTAYRELEEECGLKAKELKFIGKFAVSPGYSDEIIYLYYANEFENGTVHLDDDEVLSCEWVDIERAIKMAKNGEIFDGKTLVALYKYKAGLI